MANRWLLSEFSGAANRLCVYISQTDDPITGAGCLPHVDAILSSLLLLVHDGVGFGHEVCNVGMPFGVELYGTDDPTVVRAVVTCDPDTASADALAATTSDLGYPTTVIADDQS